MLNLSFRSLAFLSLLAPAAAAQGGGTETQMFSAPAPAPLDVFGESLAIDGSRLAVWSVVPPSQGLSFWVRDAAGPWEFEGEVNASFGISPSVPVRPVDLQGERAVVPGHGAAVTALFERAGDGSWSEVAELAGAEPNTDNNHALATIFGDRVAIGIFGLVTHRVAIFERAIDGSWPEADQVEIGITMLDIDSNSNAIAVATEDGADRNITILEELPGAGWGIADVLLAPPFHGKFAERIDLEGDQLVAVSGFSSDDELATVYERGADGKFQLVQVLRTASGSVFDTADVVVLDDRIVASEDFGTGRLVVFERGPDGTWQERLFLSTEPPTVLFGFGRTVALGPGWCASGARTGPSWEPGHGAVASFDLSGLYPKGSGLSISGGGAQGLILRPGLETAGQSFAILGSLSGTSPGLPLTGGFELPLVVDNYLISTFSSLGTAQSLVQPSFGQLSSDAAASTALMLPAGLNPALVGRVAHHALVTLDAAGVPTTVSAPVAVLLGP